MDHKVAADPLCMKAARHPARFAADERGQIIGGWLVKILLIVAVFGFSVFEVGMIIINNLSVKQAASEIGGDVQFAIQQRSAAELDPVETAKAAADDKRVELLDSPGCEASRTCPLSYDVTKQTVTVTVRRSASTIVVHRLEFMKKHTTKQATNTRKYG